jgi:hypothetical protein
MDPSSKLAAADALFREYNQLLLEYFEARQACCAKGWIDRVGAFERMRQATQLDRKLKLLRWEHLINHKLLEIGPDANFDSLHSRIIGGWSSSEEADLRASSETYRDAHVEIAALFEGFDTMALNEPIEKASKDPEYLAIAARFNTALLAMEKRLKALVSN